MVPEKKINEVVQRLRHGGGANLQSVVLYGSAISGGFHAHLSDVNLLCIVRDASFVSLAALESAIQWWNRQKQPTPIVMTEAELQRAAGVFAIELLDIQQHRRVLFGEDVLQAIQVPMESHRFQVRYELWEKSTLLRQHVLRAGRSESRVWELLLHSAPSFATLFRHALIALGESPRPEQRREAVALLAKRLSFDAQAFQQVQAVRAGQAAHKNIPASDILPGYLAAVEHVTAAMDALLRPAVPNPA